MAFQVSPGVNVSEVDLTTVIPAVSTTEAGYAGHFRWGPVGERVLITSEDDLVNNFQKPLTSNTATDFFVASNFLAYGNALFTVRVINETGSDSTDAGRNAISAAANTKNTIVKSDQDYDDNYSSGISGVGNWIGRYPGELGNSLKVSVCASSNAFSSSLTGNVQPVNGSKTLAGLGTLFQTQVRVGDILVLGPDKELRKADRYK